MYDVAIVGAGPTGVVTAALCGRYGLSAVAFDREADVYDLPRAAGLHDDAQRILSNAGLLEAILPFTREYVGAEFVDAAGRRLTGIDFPNLRTMNGFPPVLAISQPGLEQAMRGCLERYEGIHLRVSHEVLGIEPHADHVELAVRDRARGEADRVAAHWLVGADGASSLVRKLSGISWNSLGYDREWLVIDVECAPGVEFPKLCQQICDPARPTTVVPMPGALHRWEFQLRPGESREEMEREDRVWALLRPWMSRGDGRILRAVVYRFHATIAETFRRGRVFLAGDAAHQTPPFMGQGLCTGVRDADNLVWKLASVKRGRGSDALLDTYDEERHPAAVAMVQHSANTGRLIDAYAEMAITGKPPPADLVEYGYGGSRQLPGLDPGTLVRGEGPWSGRLMPQCRVTDGNRSGSFDELAGSGWAVLTAGAARSVLGEEAYRAWQRLEPSFLAIDDPAGDALLAPGNVAIVRPDRIVYSLGEACLPPEVLG